MSAVCFPAAYSDVSLRRVKVALSKALKEGTQSLPKASPVAKTRLQWHPADPALDSLAWIRRKQLLPLMWLSSNAMLSCSAF